MESLSLYDQARKVPVPSLPEQIDAACEVSEASMIFQNQSVTNCNVPNKKPIKSYQSYNVWKSRNHTVNPEKLVETYLPKSLQSANQQHIGKKQIGFASPPLQHSQRVSLSNLDQYQHCDGNVQNVTGNDCNDFVSRTVLQNSLIKTYKNASTDKKLLSHTIPSKPFEQYYMANVPTQDFDPSIIDFPHKIISSKENINPSKFGSPMPVSPKYSEAYSEDCDYLYNRQHIETTSKHERRLITNKLNHYTHDMPSKDYNNRAGHGDLFGINSVTKHEPIIDMYHYKRNNNHQQNETFNANRCSEQDNFQQRKIYQMDVDLLKPHRAYDNRTDYDSVTNSFPNTIQTHQEISRDTTTHTNGNDDNVTTKDLLKIIQQQNEQLLILQKQMATLIENKHIPNQIEAPPHKINQNCLGHKCLTSTEYHIPQENFCKPLMEKAAAAKGAMPQFSIGVMTSFGVSIRQPQTHNKIHKDPFNRVPRIQEISETDDSNVVANEQNIDTGNILSVLWHQNKFTDVSSADTDVSLVLNEPLHIREECLSPQRSIHIDMENYSSESEDELSSHDGSTTILENVMDQIDRVLNKPHIRKPLSNDFGNSANHSTEEFKSKTMKTVEQTAIRHLKRIGLLNPSVLEETSESDITDHIASNDDYSPIAISFAEKQLFMKHLPDEQLAKIAYAQNHKIPLQKINEEPTNLIKRMPDISFACVEHLKKYNLLTDSFKRSVSKPQPAVIRQLRDTDRILDITALKQLPKFK